MVIANTIHNYPLSLLSTCPIYQQFIYINKVKEFIVFQNCIYGAISKQVMTTIQLSTKKKNSLVRPKNVYNKHATQRQKHLCSFTPVQVLIVKFHKKDN